MKIDIKEIDIQQQTLIEMVKVFNENQSNFASTLDFLENKVISQAADIAGSVSV